MHFSQLACLGLCFAATKASYTGPDYEDLPLDTIFPGPWESNIRAPANKSHITPVKIFNSEGPVSGAEAVLQDADVSGISWVISTGGLITFEFQENIGGRYVRAHCRGKKYANELAESVLKSMALKTIPTSSCHTPNPLSSLDGNAMLRVIDRHEICHYPSRSNILGSIVWRRVILGELSNTLQCICPRPTCRPKEDTGTRDVLHREDRLWDRKLGTADLGRSFWALTYRRMRLVSQPLPSRRSGSIARHSPHNRMGEHTLDTSTALLPCSTASGTPEHGHYSSLHLIRTKEVH